MQSSNKNRSDLDKVPTRSTTTENHNQRGRKLATTKRNESSTSPSADRDRSCELSPLKGNNSGCLSPRKLETGHKPWNTAIGINQQHGINEKKSAGKITPMPTDEKKSAGKITPMPSDEKKSTGRITPGNEEFPSDESNIEVIVSVYGDYHYLDYSDWYPNSNTLQEKLVSLSKHLTRDSDQSNKVIHIIKPL
jgi:hypothetical protein